MKDKAALLVAAIGLAGIAWAIWHFLGDDAVEAITILALIVAVGDNIRLRRKLQAKQ